MIDFYLKKESLKTEDKINECYEYYFNKELSYDEIYEEYDKIMNLKPKLEFTENNIFFVNGKLNNKITEFMKECLLESLKRIHEFNYENDINISDSDLNSDIELYKSDFNYYPDIYETNIAEKLLGKEELRRNIIPNEIGSIEDKCNSKFFELAPHQLLLKNLFSPNTQYKGVLIFHGVGVGKSCSGISIAENFKDVYGEKENRIIILASQNIQIGWRKTIFNPKKGDDQCTGNEYFFDEEDDEKRIIDDKQAKNKIKKYYELHGYAAFANSVKRLVEEGTKHLSDEKEKFIAQIKIIKETYSNRILIIDEVHNIRTGESQKETRNTIHFIEMVIKYSDNLRLILLTANPMYNMSSEIVWILNMLLMNDKINIINEKDIFDGEGNLINEELLKNKSKGYISYLRGENPVSFPVRLYPRHDSSRIIKNPGIPIDIFGKHISDDKRLSFLELYSSEFTGKQLEIYTQLTDKIIKRSKEKRNLDYKLRIEDETLLLQLGNIVYPGEDESEENLYGERGLLNVMNENTKQNCVQYNYKKETLEKYGEFFHKDLIGEYSSKIKSIVEIIERSEGIIFIYTNWIKSGVIPLVLALEQNGYQKYNGKQILKTDKKIEPISYEGKTISEYEDKKNFIPAKYMVISGSSMGLTNKLEEELHIATSDENKDGHKIKIIIGSSVASEGLDFKNIRTIHILEPWHNINKLEQVIGRGLRNCSHKLLDPKERNVTVYLHSGLLQEKESIDIYLYRYSEYKAKQIGIIENLLKSNAIDKYFYKNANYISEKDIGNFKVQPAYIYEDGNPKTFTYNGGDKKFSRVCSFSNVCNYMKNDVPKKINIDDDTFQIQYSKGIIEIYKKRIHNLYLQSVSYTLDEIINHLSEYKTIHYDFLYHALREMEIEKYILHNKNGDKGYLISNDGYYNFQPYFNEDKLISSYYRLNKGNTKKIDYTIESKSKRKSDIIFEKQSFNEDLILKIYNKIKNFQFFEHEKKLLKYLNLENENIIKYSYLFDRLSFDDKLILGYSVLLYLKEGESYEEELFMNLLIECFHKLFIYYDGNKFIYYNKFEAKNRDNLIGFILYHNINKKPIFYQYNRREIEVYNKVDEIDIVRMIKQNQNNKSFIFNDSWGFTTYSDRIKLSDPIYTHNGIVLKVIKKSDKLRKNYVYPPGPGVVIQDQSTGAWIGESTLKFIQDELSKYLDRMTESHKKLFIESNLKREYVCFIELGLRMNQSLIQNDLIFMKYY